FAGWAFRRAKPTPEKDDPARLTEESAPVARTPATPPGPSPANPEQLPLPVLYYLDLGDRHLAAGLERDAEQVLTEAIRLAPQDPRPLLKRAFLYKKTDLFQKALDDLHRALQLDPKLADARTGRGSIYVQLKDYARAVPELDEALRLDPRDAQARAYRGWAHF